MNRSFRLPHARAAGLLALLLAGSAAEPASGQQTHRISLPDMYWDFHSDGCDVSDDGQQVVYASYSSNAGRDRGRVERYDRSTATTTTIVSSPTIPFARPAISGDGSTIAFVTTAALDPADGNSIKDVYVSPPSSSSPLLVSAADGTTSTAGNGQSEKVRLSGDGDLIAFESWASNLTSDSLKSVINVFVRTLSTNATRLVSSDASGVAGNGISFDPSISDDGRYVAFQSFASNLVAGDTNFKADIFVKDLASGAIVLVSRSSAGALGNGTSLTPSLSSDGRFVAFISQSTNLGGGTTLLSRVYRHDRDPDANGIFDEGNGVTEQVSIDLWGHDSDETCAAPHISLDGQRVLFFGLSGVDYGLNQNRSIKWEVFIRDLVTGKQHNVHVDSDGNHATITAFVEETHLLALSGDGTIAVYQTFADLDPAVSDGNLQLDVFAHDIAKDRTEFLGSDKRGSNGFLPEFSVVGGTGAGESADFRLRRAPVSSFTAVFVATATNPFPFAGGTLLPIPADVLFTWFITDPNGSFTGTLVSPGSGPLGPLDVYVQFAIADRGLLTQRWAISNTLKVTIDP